MEHLIQFFEYEHLPEHLKSVSQPFYITAHNLYRDLPRNPESTVALRKLLESKDCAVRAVVAYRKAMQLADTSLLDKTNDIK